MEEATSSSSSSGRKTFPKKLMGGVQARQTQQQRAQANTKKTLGKNRPKEISSKQPGARADNPFFRLNKEKKKKMWDPRFDSRAGEFRAHVFQEDYEFLEDIRKEEEKELHKELKFAKKRDKSDRAEEIQMALKKMNDRRKTAEEVKRQRETRKALEEENVQRMLRGEKPQFKTKAQLRQLDAESKFAQLKKDGKLNKYMERKKKREAGKEKKKAKSTAEKFENRPAPARFEQEFNAKYGYQ